MSSDVLYNMVRMGVSGAVLREMTSAGTLDGSRGRNLKKESNRSIVQPATEGKRAEIQENESVPPRRSKEG